MCASEHANHTDKLSCAAAGQLVSPLSCICKRYFCTSALQLHALVQDPLADLWELAAAEELDPAAFAGFAARRSTAGTEASFRAMLQLQQQQQQQGPSHLSPPVQTQHAAGRPAGADIAYRERAQSSGDSDSEHSGEEDSESNSEGSRHIDGESVTEQDDRGSARAAAAPAVPHLVGSRSLLQHQLSNATTASAASRAERAEAQHVVRPLPVPRPASDMCLLWLAWLY